MRRVPICWMLAAALAVSGCDFLKAGGGSNGDGSAEKIMVLGEDDSVGNIPADQATVTEVGLRGNKLKLEVKYSGGCQQHEFSLYAIRGFVETHPPLAEVYLAHDSNGDPCRELITDELTFDVLLLANMFLQMYSKRGAFYVNVHEPNGRQTRFEHIDPEPPLYTVN